MAADVGTLTASNEAQTTKAKLERIEAPVTVKAYFMCAFAAFAGILFGFDSGYINGVLGTAFVKQQLGYPNPDPASVATEGPYIISTSNTSLIVSILSAGTFFGALFSGFLADWIGRRLTIISGCVVFSVGVIIQVASTGVPALAVGRVVAGIGIGFVSAINILYMSEVAPRKVRGAIVSCYQFFITIGLLLAAVITYGVQNRNDTGSYRIPIGIQWIWALILLTGMLFLPESPRYYIKKGRIAEATKALCAVRGQPEHSDYIRDELAEIVANAEYEKTQGTSWINLFSGSIFKHHTNSRKVFIGAGLQMMQQWTGVNFIFYYSTTFFQIVGFQNPFLISMITTIVNVGSTPISFYTIERFGRRPLLIYGAVCMCICEFIVAITGSASSTDNLSAQKAMIAFVCIYIFFFASTWGPCAWVSIGEIFPITMRAKGVAVSTASNWFWNCIIGVITPYMMKPEYGNLGTRVFYVWGSTCGVCILFAYFLVPETKGLSLEQVDLMMSQVNARHTPGWRPDTTFQTELAHDDEKAGHYKTADHEHPEHIEHADTSL